MHCIVHTKIVECTFRGELFVQKYFKCPWQRKENIYVYIERVKEEIEEKGQIEHLREGEDLKRSREIYDRQTDKVDPSPFFYRSFTPCFSQMFLVNVKRELKKIRIIYSYDSHLN